ncbi:MAG: DUF6788 family protein [Acidimicrobiales bacterium]
MTTSVDPERERGKVRLDAKTTADAKRLADEIAATALRGLALPGTLVERRTRCGRPGCRCGGDPPVPHGPYFSWTRKVDGKTRTRYLSAEQHADYQEWFDTAKRLRDLVAALEGLGLSIVEADPRTPRRH